MPEKKNKHLVIQDRVAVQKGIEEGRSLSAIARDLGVATSTVSREIKNNRKFFLPGKRQQKSLCIHRANCNKVGICGSCTMASCKSCSRVQCFEVCPDFVEQKCEILQHAPFVCGNCHRHSLCGYRHAVYLAVDAQLAYSSRLVETREGISLTPEQLQSVVWTVRRCLKRGWSLEAIWATYGKAMPISVRTMYSYIQSGALGLANIDLPKKVKYKPRKKVADYRKIDRDGRSFSDFLDLRPSVQERAIQMDTVIGTVRDFKCILTLHFPYAQFQIMILLDDHTCEAVVGALDWIESIIGTKKFKELFGTILTDRGMEFCDFEAIEESALGPQKRTSLYYCDPRSANQKASCEKNHTFIRRILPKGTSFEELTQYDVATICSHINSYPRKSLGNKTPFEATSKLMPKALLDELGLAAVKPENVMLKPELLK